MVRQNENFLDRIKRYGGVQRQPRVMARPQFVQRGGFVPQQRVQQETRVQQYRQQPRYATPQPQQREYSPEEIFNYRLEMAKREYAQNVQRMEAQRQAAYGVPQMGEGAAAKPYQFLMGEAARLGAQSNGVPQQQVPQGYVPQQAQVPQQPAEPEEPPLTEEEESELRIRMMYSDYTRECAEHGAQPVSFQEFVQALIARSQAQQAQAANVPPQGVEQQGAPVEQPQVAQVPTEAVPQQ